MKKILFSPLIWIILFYIFINFITFRNLNLTFYQQDEWLGLGQIWAEGWKSVISGFSFWQLLFADGRPLTRVFGVLFFGPFAFNSTFLAIYSVGFHIVNTILVFLIARKLFRSQIPAFIAGLFFAVNSVASQAVTWFGASFGTQPAAFLTFLPLYLFVTFLQTKKNSYFYASLIFAVISLYFKESDVFLFLLFPLIHLFYEKDKKKLFSQYKILYLPFVIFVAIFCIFRVTEMLFAQRGTDSLLTSQVFANIGTQNLFISILLRSILYPLTSLSLLFIPTPISTVMGFSFFQIYYPTVIVNHPDAVVFTVVLDLIAVILSMILILFFIFIWTKNSKVRKPLFFSFVLFVLSILPYIVIAKSYSYLESRYYYVPNAAAALLLGCIAMYFIQKPFKWSKIVSVLLGIFFVYYLFINIQIIRQGIHDQMYLATVRRGYITQLLTDLPTLKTNTNVFYITGDTPYLVDGNKTPFQNGFGYSVMVLYFKSGKIPNELLDSGYLWILGEEGYKKIDGKTFGYFDNLNDLKKTVKKYHINLSDIHGFYYNSHTRILDDISKKTRQEI